MSATLQTLESLHDHILTVISTLNESTAEPEPQATLTRLRDLFNDDKVRKAREGPDSLVQGRLHLLTQDMRQVLHYYLILGLDTMLNESFRRVVRATAVVAPSIPDTAVPSTVIAKELSPHSPQPVARSSRKRRRLDDYQSDAAEEEQHPPSKKSDIIKFTLPEDSKAYLYRWLVEKRDHPYPTEKEKAEITFATGLTVTQVNNVRIFMLQKNDI
ncbi:hypothetical protein HDV05_004690 [Chytridiales sp. JEL 0842]|nr:hypothetical protein HDV05_004690 [Chytridiales sp. JEL 0842]